VIHSGVVLIDGNLQRIVLPAGGGIRSGFVLFIFDCDLKMKSVIAPCEFGGTGKFIFRNGIFPRQITLDRGVGNCGSCGINNVFCIDKGNQFLER
jgi:hypothetical protein